MPRRSEFDFLGLRPSFGLWPKGLRAEPGPGAQPGEWVYLPVGGAQPSPHIRRRSRDSSNNICWKVYIQKNTDENVSPVSSAR